MELRVLQYFLAVAREENISAAADFLHITQPTLSRQMIELEEELGCKLFLRGSRKITLTEEGVRFRKRAEEITELVQKTEAEFQTTDEIVSGDIYIGGGETDGMRIIADVACSLVSDHPNIRFHIFSGNADDVSQRIDSGLLDFGVLINPADIAKYDYMHLPSVDTWGVIMRKDSSLAQNETISPEDLWDKPLLTSRQSLVSNEISNWFKRDHESLNFVATYNLIFNASLLVEQGMGYALGLDKLINTTGESSICFRPLCPKLEARMNIVWKKYQVFPKATEFFLKRLEEKLTGLQ